MTTESAPRIVCSTVSLFSTPVHEAFELLAETGFGGIEIMVTKDPGTQDGKRLRGLADAHGLQVAAIHAPFLLVTRSVWGTEPVGKVDRAIELAEEVGAPLVVAHPPYRWQTGYRRWLQDELPTLSERTGVRVAVENMFPLRVRGRRVASFHSVRTLEDLEGFEDVVLDTSHAAVAGLDLLDALERLRGRIAHVHLSDNAGRGWDSHLPVGEGVLPLGPFLDVLAVERFTGAVSLEVDLRRHREDPDALRRALSSNREFCAERLPLAV